MCTHSLSQPPARKRAKTDDADEMLKADIDVAKKEKKQSGFILLQPVSSSSSDTEQDKWKREMEFLKEQCETYKKTCDIYNAAVESYTKDIEERNRKEEAQSTTITNLQIQLKEWEKAGKDWHTRMANTESEVRNLQTQLRNATSELTAHRRLLGVTIRQRGVQSTYATFEPCHLTHPLPLNPKTDSVN